jgi:chloramphenicol-sensitive protein RarD
MSPAFHRLSEPNKGVLFAIIAHLFWGGMAVYFGLIRHINPMEIAVNRGVWSIPVAAVIVAWLGQFDEVWAALKNPKTVLTLALTSAIIVFNWTFYIWCIQQGRTLEASLGYFINPLLNGVAGYFFLGERFTKGQILAIILAAFAVTVQTIATGVFPYLGITLGLSFCTYGLIRKKVAVSPVPGFFVEVLLVAVPLLALEAWLANNGQTHFGDNAFDTLMLLGCGALTAGALIFYAASIKRLRYSTAGLLQYISPTLVFLTAVFVFHESMDKWKMMSFIIIWIALAIYSVSSLQEERAKKLAAA